MNTVYFSTGLIPVQEWISEATRSRDLMVGSKFLSWLHARILQELISELGAKVLVPHQHDDTELMEGVSVRETTFVAWLKEPDMYGIPNRASGSVAGYELDDVVTRLKYLEKDFLREKWNELIELAKEDHLLKNSKLKGEIASPHSLCPIRLVWVAFESDASVDEAFPKLNGIYDAVKRTRPLEPSPPERTVGKCLQCARRDAAGGADWHQWRDFWEVIDNEYHVQRGRRIQTSERLCTTCLVKRFAGYAKGVDDFPSTNDIAAAHWVAQVKEHVEFKYSDYLEKAKSCQLTKDDLHLWLYDRTIDNWRKGKPKIEGDDAVMLKTQLGEIVKARSNLIEAIKNLPIKTEPSNYLAVMTFDGDSMGKLVAADPVGMSEKMNTFGAAVAPLVITHHGTPFYIGGDEGLLLCPLETAIDLAFDIRRKFEDVMNEPSGASGKGRITLSSGLIFFDRQRPMSGAIREAHATIEQAKARMDGNGKKVKNALAVTVQTTSGNVWTCRAGWDDWTRIRNAVELVLTGPPKDFGVPDCRLSSGWAYDIESFLTGYDDGNEWGNQRFRAAVRTELKRLTFRRLHETGDKKLTGAHKEKIWSGLLQGDEWFREAPRKDALTLLFNQLHLVGFLVRETCLASVDDQAGEDE
ncbi:hypothetical protein JW905_07655 [bacterium]|nr:hypothetical protein [candidate division CSSED10-310 bacterium]